MAGVLKASLALHLLSVLLLPLLIATNDFSSILSITNNCSFTVWPAAIPVGGGTQLDPGQTWTIGVPAGGISSGRLWGRTGCSFRSGQGVCKTGDCAGVLSCTQSGEPPNTLAEFSLGGTIDFFDISVIDGFNLAMDFLPVPAKGAPVCSKGPRCQSSQCPDAYRTPTEDKTFACPRGTNYQLVFCPSIDRTPSLSPTLVPSRASSSPQLAPSPAPAIQLAPSLSPTLVPLPSGEIATRSSSGSRVSVILAIAGGCIFLTVLFIAIFFIRKRRNRHQDTEEVEEFGELQGIPIKFTFQQLRVATEDFRVILGEGGFGTVFKGQFGEDIIAVKRLDQTGQGKREFLAEVQTIGSIHHINLVRLIGFCAEKSHRLLVYEFMPKGSLDRWIYYRQGNSTRAMDWGMRCKIITHIAKGLCYLHEECTKRIAHLDVKPQNILLDDNFNAKLSDFGMCKLIDRDKSQVITRMRGTPGYLAPEWLTSQITEKADIYSFGVVVMEIISGRKNLDTSRSEESVHLITLLEERVQNGQLADLIDKHNSDMQVHKQDIIQMMKLAMWCLQIDSKKRPRMSDVVKVLEGDMNVETNIDHNFVATCQTIVGVAGNASSSSPHLASDVSGPR